MKIGDRLKALRRRLGLSQGDMGAQGVISTPGWIKIENNQRSPSEKLLRKLVDWLVTNHHMRSAEAKRLHGELLAHKYLGDRSPFIRRLVIRYAKEISSPLSFRAAEEAGTYRVKRPARPSPNKRSPHVGNSE